MPQKLIKLKVIGISYSQTQSGAYALILGEEDGERRIPIIIGGFEAQAIVIKLENLEPPRPLTHDLFKSFADACGVIVDHILINKLREGIFYSQIMCTGGMNDFTIDSRTSDAVALALRFGCPIYIVPSILEEAGIIMTTTPDEEGSEPKNRPKSLIEEPSSYRSSEYEDYSDEELPDLLADAIKREDYEQAAAIRDEIDRRKK